MFSLKLRQDTMTPALRKMTTELTKTLPQEAKNKFVQETPKKSGNARRSTKLVDTTIKANYPYAKKLDDGSSKQSPEGMSKPTIEFIKRRLQKIIGGR